MKDLANKVYELSCLFILSAVAAAIGIVALVQEPAEAEPDYFCSMDMYVELPEISYPEVFYTNSEGVFYVADNSLASYAYLVGEDLNEVEAYFQWAAEGFFEDPDYHEIEQRAAEEFEDD